MKSKNIAYIPAIDQLRGLAALLIVLYHGVTLISYSLRYARPFQFDHWLHADSWVEALVYEGHTAVALFMVLSGFIFTLGAYKREISYGQFIKNRFLRTYPLYLLVLFVGIAASPSSFNVPGFIASLFFMSNTPVAIGVEPYTSMFWAVAVEWQFYLVFPFIIRWVNLSGTINLAGLILVFILFRVLLFYMGANIRDVSYWTIIGRMDQFLVGMALGVYYRKFFRPGALYDGLFILAVLAVCYTLFMFNRAGGWLAVSAWKLIWPTLEALVWGAFILGYLSFSRWLPALITRPLIMVGLVSYSMYLVHFILVFVAIKQGFLLQPFSDRPVANALVSTLLVVLPCLLLFATMTYHFIEKPFLQLRRVYSR